MPVVRGCCEREEKDAMTIFKMNGFKRVDDGAGSSREMSAELTLQNCDDGDVVLTVEVRDEGGNVRDSASASFDAEGFAHLASYFGDR